MKNDSVFSVLSLLIWLNMTLLVS